MHQDIQTCVFQEGMTVLYYADSTYIWELYNREMCSYCFLVPTNMFHKNISAFRGQKCTLCIHFMAVRVVAEIVNCEEERKSPRHGELYRTKVCLILKPASTALT